LPKAPSLPKAPAGAKAPARPKAPKAPSTPKAPTIPSGKGEITVRVDGTPIKFDVPPQMSGGTVFVPLRGVFEKMGARVDFNKATGVVKAWRKQTTVELKVGDRLSKVNGNTVFMLQPAFSKDGRTLVPLRFLGESLGAQVAWDPMHRIVQISAGR